MKNINSRCLSAASIAAILLCFCGSIASASEKTASALSLSLSDALRLVKQTNLSVIQADEDADAAAAAARSVRAIGRPSISATAYGALGSASNILSSSPNVTPQNLFVAPSRGVADQNATLMAPLFTGERLSGQTESARQQSSAAGYGIRAAQLAAQSDMAQAYAHALLTNELLAVATAKADAEQEQVKITQEKVEAGHMAEVDLLREQAELADTQQAQLAATNDAALAMIDLKTLLGRELGGKIELTDTLDTALAAQPKLPETLRDALEEAQRIRPELSAANALTKAADAHIQAAIGAYAPQIYGVGMVDATEMDGNQSVGLMVGVSVSLPLYDAGQRRADLDAAHALADRARTDALKARQTVAQQVSSAWLNLQTALALLDSTKTETVAASESYRLADLRYNAGKSTTAERLDALAAKTRAEGALAQAKAAVIVGRESLLAAIGWDADGDAASFAR